MLQQQGKLSLAEPCRHAALTGFRRVLGDGDPESLRSMDELTGPPGGQVC